MNSIKGPPLSKKEVSLLVELIKQNSIITSKQTNAGSNRMKEQAWQFVAEQFNASIASGPRKPTQLRLKWDNLKKSARRRVANVCNREGFCIPQDDILDAVLLLLDNASDSGDSGPSEGADLRESDLDVEGSVKTSSLSRSTVDSESDEVENSTPILCDVKTKSRCRVIQRRRSDVVRKNIAIAEYYEAKKRKVNLEIKKLQLEIDARLNNFSSYVTSAICNNRDLPSDGSDTMDDMVIKTEER